MDSNLVKKAQQQFCFLRTLKKNNLSTELHRAFYQCAVESVLTYCLTAWYANCIEADQKSLQRVIKRAEKIVGLSLLSLENIFCTCCLHRAKSILADVTHPCHHLFSPLPSSRWYRALKARTSRLHNSFYPKAITLRNNEVSQMDH